MLYIGSYCQCNSTANTCAIHDQPFTIVMSEAQHAFLTMAEETPAPPINKFKHRPGDQPWKKRVQR